MGPRLIVAYSHTEYKTGLIPRIDNWHLCVNVPNRADNQFIYMCICGRALAKTIRDLEGVYDVVKPAHAYMYLYLRIAEV